MQSPVNALLQNASTESPLFMHLSTAEAAQVNGGLTTGINGMNDLNIYSFGNIPVRTAAARPPAVNFQRLGQLVESFLRSPGPFTDERSVQTVNQVFTNLSALNQ